MWKQKNAYFEASISGICPENTFPWVDGTSIFESFVFSEPLVAVTPFFLFFVPVLPVASLFFFVEPVLVVTFPSSFHFIFAINRDEPVDPVCNRFVKDIRFQKRFGKEIMDEDLIWEGDYGWRLDFRNDLGRKLKGLWFFTDVKIWENF